MNGEQILTQVYGLSPDEWEIAYVSVDPRTHNGLSYLAVPVRKVGIDQDDVTQPLIVEDDGEPD